MHRPTSVTVFGMVNIALALFGLLGHVLMLTVFPELNESGFDPGKESGVMTAWTAVAQPVDFIANCFLLLSGIGLLRMRPWGRRTAIAYSVYAIIVTFISTAIAVSVFDFQPQDLGVPVSDKELFVGIGIVFAVIGIGFSLVHPVLLLYYMTRPYIAAAFSPSIRSTSEESTNTQPSSLSPYAPSAEIEIEPTLSDGNTEEQVLESIVPIKNKPALLAYYTGLFSLFPVFGLPLAIIAIVSGRRGLDNAIENPEVQGKVHARIGLTCGWLFGLFNLMLTGLIALAIIGKLTSGQ